MDAHGLLRRRLSEYFRVKNAREYLYTINDTRAGAAKIRSGIHGPHLISAELRPACH